MTIIEGIIADSSIQIRIKILPFPLPPSRPSHAPCTRTACNLDQILTSLNPQSLQLDSILPLTFFVLRVLMTDDLPTLGYPMKPTEMNFLSLCSRLSCRSRPSRLPLPKGFVTLAWNASVGYSFESVPSQRLVTQAGTCMTDAQQIGFETIDNRVTPRMQHALVSSKATRFNKPDQGMQNHEQKHTKMHHSWTSDTNTGTSKTGED